MKAPLDFPDGQSEIACFCLLFHLIHVTLIFNLELMPGKFYLISLIVTLNPLVIVIWFIPISMIAISLKMHVEIVLPCNFLLFILFFCQISGDESFTETVWIMN